MRFQKGHKINLGKKNHLGFKLSDEQIKRLSDSHKGIKPSQKAIEVATIRMTGRSNPNWKDGITKNTLCLDCGKKIYWGSKRCKKCYGISRRGVNHYNWKGGDKRNNCSNCGSKIWSTAKMCKKCFKIIHRGQNHWNWQSGITKEKDYDKLYYQKNKDRLLFEMRRRNIRKLKNGGSHTLGEWEHLKALYNWTCPGCWRKKPEIKLTEDHIVPLSKGGSDNIENIQPLCKPCNSRKHNKIIKKYEI